MCTDVPSLTRARGRACLRRGSHVPHEGGSYVGAWVHGKKHGHGKMIYANGTVYDGAWLANERHGRGAQTDNGGNKYLGEWEHGKRHGTGSFTFGTTGVQYVGAWSDDRMHGDGVLREPRGKRVEGTWGMGKRNGAFVTTYAGLPKVEREVYKEGQLMSYEEEERELAPAADDDAEGVASPASPASVMQVV